MENHPKTFAKTAAGEGDVPDISRVRFITYLFYLLLGLPIVAIIMGACKGGGGGGGRQGHP